MFPRQALVIGNSDYILKPRYSCIYDANDMSYALRSIGFLTHSAINLDSSDLRERMNRFALSIQPNSIVLFYFSGLAVQYDGNTYLMPIDNQKINTDNVKKLSVNLDSFIQDMVKQTPRAIVVILDSCRPVQPLIFLRPFFDREALGLTQGLAPIYPPPSTIVAYSCGLGANDNHFARNARNSLYTYYLLQYITTPNVDIHTILKNVALNVQRDTGGRQIPDRYSSVQEHLCLVINPYVKGPSLFDGIQQDSAVQSMNIILPHSAYFYHKLAILKSHHYNHFNFSTAFI